MNPEIDALEHFFAAVNRNDMEAITRDFDPHWIDGRFADGFVFRNGRITEYHSFGERVQALEWAGIKGVEL